MKNIKDFILDYIDTHGFIDPHAIPQHEMIVGGREFSLVGLTDSCRKLVREGAIRNTEKSGRAKYARTHNRELTKDDVELLWNQPIRYVTPTPVDQAPSH